MDEYEEDERNCGRYIFREADLAYLLIDKERMFPLAELLASLFSNTARTTLFTRMEKINTRRHFCSADEIKLLKTVNGIHGSSAICTLIPEADVQKYCDIYIDRTVDLKLFSKGKRTRKESTRRKHNQSKDGTEGSNSTVETHQEMTAANSNVGSDKVNTIKSLKRKTQTSSFKQKINDGAKSKASWEGHDSLISNHSQLLGECSDHEEPNSAATLSEHVTTNYTQTLPLLSDQAIKARKKRKAKHCLEDEFTTNNSTQKKRSKNKHKAKNIISTSKVSREADSTNVIDGRSSLAMPRSSLTDNLENPCASSLSQCLTNANSEILFSDSSSNDSGFASTATSENHNSPLSLDKHGMKIPSKVTFTLPSPSKQNKKTKSKKNKNENSDFCGKKRDPSLSPPALVLKRQNNTWQVETKIEHETHKRAETQPCNPAKKQLKWHQSSTVNKLNVKINNEEIPGKKLIKKKRKQKNNISDKDAVERNVGVKKRIKRRKLKKDNKLEGDIKETAGVNPVNLSSIRENSLSSIQIKSCKKPRKRGKKQINSTNSTNIDHSQHSKKHSIAAKSLKANKNFKLMGLFSSFPFLTMKDGDLCPAYSEAVPEHCKQPTTHPISKWRLGGPIFIHENTKTS